MKAGEVLKRVEGESPKTSYAKGLKAYAADMLRGIEGGLDAELPTQFAPCQKVFLGDEDDWKCASLNRRFWDGSARDIADRLGLLNVVDYEKSDIHAIEGDAMKSAFMLIWAEVCAMARMEETFLIRRTMGRA